jgi:hypothetical protein
MDSPKDTYEKLKHIDNIRDVAYDRLFNTYLKYDLKGDHKLIDIESTDQESLVKRLAFGRPVPGMIYTFINLSPNNLQELQNLKTGKTIQFHDFTPICFCTSFNPMTALMKGLNLTMLPSSERLKFLQAYFNNYKLFLDRIEEKTEYNKLAVNINYMIISLTGKNPQLFKQFNDQQGAFFEYAYRSYHLQNLAKFRMIEYEEWKYIPFYDAQQSFKKINIAEIHRTYWDNKNANK